MCVKNTKCPYCGSENITADCEVRVTGKLNADGTISVKDDWDISALNETVNESACSDIQGFCYDCGKYSDFSWKNGFVANANISSEAAMAAAQAVARKSFINAKQSA